MDKATIDSLLAQGEIQNIDFKGDERFDGDFRAHIAAAIIAFSNTSGGGTLIIGVDKNTNKVIGVSRNNIPSYDPTQVANYLKERVSILPTFTIERFEYEANIILLINIKEFDDLPIIITKSIANSKKTYAQPGDVLIRTKSCECRRINSYEEMQDLLTRSLMKRSELLLSQIKVILSGEQPVTAQIEPEEVFIRLLPTWQDKLTELNDRLSSAAHWEFQILPLSPDAITLEMHQIPNIIRRASVRWRGWSFPQDFERLNSGRYFSNYAEVAIKLDQYVFCHDEFWQMSDKAAFGQARGLWQDIIPQQTDYNYPPPPNRLISYKDVCWSISECFRFATNISELLTIDELWIRIALVNINERILGEYDNLYLSIGENWKSFSSKFEVTGTFSRSQLVSSWKHIAQEWTKQAFTVFQWPHVQREFIEKLQKELESRQY